MINLLAIKLFVNKYYDFVFLGALFLIVLLIFILRRLMVQSKFLLSGLNVVKTKKGELLILFVILIVGFSVRLYKIDNPIADWHSFRQADTASVSRIFTKDGIDLFYPKYHDISTTQSGIFNPNGYRFVEFPIYNVVHATAYNMFSGISLEVWGRLLSIFAAVITAYIVYLIGKRFISGVGGLLSAFFYLFIPYNIYFTRVILPEPAATMLATWALWLFIRYIDKKKSYYLVLVAVVFSMAILIKPFVIFYAVPMLLLAIAKWGIKGLFARRELIIAGIIAVIPFLLWRSWIGKYPEGIPFWKWVFNGDGIRFRPAFWYWIFGERLGKLILGVWGIIPFVVGLISMKKKGSFIIYFGLGMLFYVGVVATANVKHDYYQTLIIPFVALAVAQGTLAIWNNSGFNKIMARVFVFVSIVLALTIGAFQVKEFYKINRPEIIIAGEAVGRLTPSDSLIIAPYNGDTAFLYQTKRRGWPVVDRPIEQLVEKGAAYFVSVDLNHPQTLSFQEDYEVVEKTNEYIIINLTIQTN